MIRKWFITYEMYGVYVNNFAEMLSTEIVQPELLEGIYGPPKGGLPIATHVSHHFNTDLILDLDQYIEKMPIYTDFTKYILIVDDICDSGKTFYNINNILNEYLDVVIPIFASIFVKPRSHDMFNVGEKYIQYVDNDVWLVFPWERNENPDKNYMK